MEPVTQGLLGAAVGQLGWRQRLGRRALLWGALIAMVPDLDVLFGGLHRGFGEFVYHRGTSHSLWFGFAVGPMVGWWLWRSRGRIDPIAAWIGLCVAVLVTHPLLDAFTPFGTQLLAPFDRTRFSWEGVGNIDPLYTALLGLAVVFGARRSVSDRAARVAAAVALALTTVYLGWGVWLNERAEARVMAELRYAGRAPVTLRAYPTLFQPFLRRVIARGPEVVRIGLYTPLGDGRTFWESEFREATPGPLARDLLDTWEGRTFTQFAMGETTTYVREVPQGKLVEIEDLRFALPGTIPTRGLWGIRALYDASGRRIGPVERYDGGRLEQVVPISVAIWRATWGDYTGVETLKEGGRHLPRIPVPTVRSVQRRLLATRPSSRKVRDE
jgi:inner membrane protein